ncbi:MAG: hypothetical protein O2924_04035, partial [Chloroflexi bacterium]|nr:hypothetical protein [Chloroflexota bacterium]
MHTPVTSASVKSPWRIARGRFLLALAAFALMLIATLSLVGHRASAAELRAPGTQSAIAEQTEDTEDNPPASAPDLPPENGSRCRVRAALVLGRGA